MMAAYNKEAALLIGLKRALGMNEIIGVDLGIVWFEIDGKLLKSPLNEGVYFNQAMKLCLPKDIADTLLNIRLTDTRMKCNKMGEVIRVMDWAPSVVDAEYKTEKISALEDALLQQHRTYMAQKFMTRCNEMKRYCEEMKIQTELRAAAVKTLEDQLRHKERLLNSREIGLQVRSDTLQNDRKTQNKQFQLKNDALLQYENKLKQKRHQHWKAVRRKNVEYAQKLRKAIQTSESEIQCKFDLQLEDVIKIKKNIRHHFTKFGIRKIKHTGGKKITGTAHNNHGAKRSEKMPIIDYERMIKSLKSCNPDECVVVGSRGGIFALKDFKIGDVVSTVNARIRPIKKDKEYTFTLAVQISGWMAYTESTSERCMGLLANHANTHSDGNSMYFVANCDEADRNNYNTDTPIDERPIFGIAATSNICKGEEIIIEMRPASNAYAPS